MDHEHPREGKEMADSESLIANTKNLKNEKEDHLLYAIRYRLIEGGKNGQDH